MASRTYLPKLLRVLLVVCNYIGRWEDKIKEHLPPESHPLLDAVMTACEALREVLEEEIPQGT